MTKSIQALAAQAGREARANGLPCGDYVYSDPLKIENRYQSEADCIREKYGSIENWRAWDRLAFREIDTGRTVFQDEIKNITGWPLTYAPAAVIELLDQSKYEVIIRW